MNELDYIALYTGYGVLAFSAFIAVATLACISMERAYTLMRTRRDWHIIKTALREYDERQAASQPTKDKA